MPTRPVGADRASRLLFALILSLPLLRASAETRPWEVSSSLTYVTGDYGTGQDSTYIYVPFVLQRNEAWGRASLSIPFLWLDTSDAEVGTVGGGAGDTVFVSSGSTESGLGDIRLSGTYYLYNAGEWRDWAPGVDLTASIKFPTAKDSLGTGEPDLSVGFGLYDWINRDWLWFADWKYRLVGDPPDRDYDNQLILDGGVSYQSAPDLRHSVLLEHRTAIVPGDDDSRSLVYSLRQARSPLLDLFGSFELGLSDGAPDYSLTIGFEQGL